MSQGASAAAALTTLDDDAWDDLLSFIEERRVIPIVGPELLQAATERGPRLLLDCAADKLAGRPIGDVPGLPQHFTLPALARRFPSAPARRDEAHVRHPV